MKTGEKTNFIHDDWLSKEKGYSKDLPAKIKGKEALDSKSIDKQMIALLYGHTLEPEQTFMF